MQIYNSKTRSKVEFKPIAPPKVTMYVCGPTVYDEIHIGNARTFLSFDVIRRYLTHKGYDVVFAQNITDVDDKIIARAHDEGKDATTVAKDCADTFIARMRAFGVLDPTIRPFATQEIDAMCEMITKLIETGHAYVAPNGDVYFSVESVESYGEVSGRKLEEMLVGARIEENSNKQSGYDFALWKAAKPGEPAWESPWGLGRPGWHTECSAMVEKYLGTPIDIHGGGSDLVFPHHENENAQVRGANSTELAHIWMHAGMLRVDGEKMSKSLGNFYTLAEVLEKSSPAALRLLMLQTHYRSPLDFSFDRLEGAENALKRIENVIDRIAWLAESGAEEGEKDENLRVHIAQAPQAFCDAMDDDFNTALALSVVFNLVTSANEALASTAPDLEALQDASVCMQKLLAILGIVVGASSEETSTPEQTSALIVVAADLGLGTFETSEDAEKALIASRAEARAARDWERADHIRDAIQAAGFVVEDGAQGTRITQS